MRHLVLQQDPEEVEAMTHFALTELLGAMENGEYCSEFKGTGSKIKPT